MFYAAVEDMVADLISKGWTIRKDNYVGLEKDGKFIIIEPPSYKDIGLIGIIDEAGGAAYFNIDNVEFHDSPDRLVILL